MKHFRLPMLFAGMAISLLLTGIVSAQGSQLKFTATVFNVDPTDTDSGVVTISIKDIQVPIKVNGDTEIEGAGSAIALTDLNIGDQVKVDAFFSDLGIIADEISVINTRDPSFRFQGEISAVNGDAMLPEGIDFSGTPTATSSVGFTSITLLGSDVYLHEDTRIISSNPPWLPISPAELMQGDHVNVSGNFDGVLWAERIRVGHRETGEIEIDGLITMLEDDRFTIDILGGGTTTVIIDEGTYISGNLEVGLIVEVEGMLNSELSVIATELVVDTDGDGDGDDDNHRNHPGLPFNALGQGLGLDRFHRGFDVMLNSNLTAAKAIISLRQKRTPGNAQEEFGLELLDAPSDATITVIASFGSTDVEFGSMVTDENGSAEISYQSRRNNPDLMLNNLIPDGFELRDITSVQLVQEGSIILEGEI